MRNLLVVLVVVACVSASHGEVISAWDLGAGSGTNAAWTTWAELDASPLNASKVSGPLTLTHSSGFFYNFVAMGGSGAPIETGVPLLTAPTTVMRDGLNLGSSSEPIGYTISGLTIGVEYAVQFTGMILGDGTANMNITQTGGASANLAATAPAMSHYDIYYSPQFTFTATSDSTAFSLVTVGSTAGRAGVSGVIVAAIPEPASALMLGFGAIVGLTLHRVRRSAQRR